MLFNIAQTKPALNFTPGQFIDQIPSYMVKFDKIYGDNGENIDGVFIHKKQTHTKTSSLLLRKRENLFPQPIRTS